MVQNITEDEIEDVPCSDPNSPILTEYHITVPTLHDGLMHGTTHHERRLLDFLKATPTVQWLKKISLCSALTNFELPSADVHRYLHVRFIRRINWSSIFAVCKKWLKHPLNIALLIWLLCVAAAGSMLILLMLGLLNKAFPSKFLRNHWIEIDNQILNALFTLMSIYQHPYLIHHIVLLCRWRPEDAAELRKFYCNNGVCHPNERAHISFVVALLHITCICQYVDCGLYWGYPSISRSEFADNFFFILGIATPVFAGVYTVYGPLGRSSDALPDEETKERDTVQVELTETRTVVSNPAWAGGVFDCSEDPTACYLSFLCTFCVFGWNMERLGFGNMYVHTVMFLLLCVTPFWVFNITSLNIHDYVLGDVIGAAGIVLCFFGLLYGGFWRIQMRKTYGLPRSRWFCGSASLTDYVQWLFCWPCVLAQEVRTGNLYDAKDGSFYEKLMDGGDVESGAGSTVTTELPVSVGVEEGNSTGVKLSVDGEMIPPTQPLIEFEEREDTDAEIVTNGSIQLKS
uniref:PLAC8 family protein n=1 Tax=Arundo donax TaxID=35708 RepID=A0A0A8XZ48_ARUDO